jgi:hypothetical protein
MRSRFSSPSRRTGAPSFIVLHTKKKFINKSFQCQLWKSSFYRINACSAAIYCIPVLIYGTKHLRRKKILNCCGNCLFKHIFKKTITLT